MHTVHGGAVQGCYMAGVHLLPGDLSDVHEQVHEVICKSRERVQLRKNNVGQTDNACLTRTFA